MGTSRGKFLSGIKLPRQLLVAALAALALSLGLMLTGGGAPLAAQVALVPVTITTKIMFANTHTPVPCLNAGCPGLVPGQVVGENDSHTIHDDATVTSTDLTKNPTGSVVFGFYVNELECRGSTPTFVETVAIAAVGGVGTAHSANRTLTAGVYSYRTKYVPNAPAKALGFIVTTGPCEQLLVKDPTKASPTLSTVPSAGGTVGVTLNDTATLAGGNAPTGTVTFKLFPPSDPTCSGVAVYTNADPTAPYATAPGFVSSAVGVWHWTADYAGDANNNPASSGCAAEPVTVTKASPAISTVPSAGGTVGVTLNDTATLSGGNAPTGTVTFKLFPPSDPTCSGVAVYTDADPSAPYATAPGFVSNAVGVWHWTADYAGDANNNPASSGCAAEPVTVGNPSTLIIKKVDDSTLAVALAGASFRVVPNPFGACQAVFGGVYVPGAGDFLDVTDNVAPDEELVAVGVIKLGTATDPDGPCDQDNGVASYTITELTAPAGYVADPAPKVATFNAPPTPIIAQATFVNRRKDEGCPDDVGGDDDGDGDDAQSDDGDASSADNSDGDAASDDGDASSGDLSDGDAVSDDGDASSADNSDGDVASDDGDASSGDKSDGDVASDDGDASSGDKSDGDVASDDDDASSGDQSDGGAKSDDGDASSDDQSDGDAKSDDGDASSGDKSDCPTPDGEASDDGDASSDDKSDGDAKSDDGDASSGDNSDGDKASDDADASSDDNSDGDVGSEDADASSEDKSD